MGRRGLTDNTVAALKPRAKAYAHPDPALPSFYVRVMPSGVKSYCAVAKDPLGNQKWKTIGKTGELGVEQAREKARVIISAVRAGHDASGAETFQAVAEQWLQRHVDKKELRSADKTRWRLKKYLLPVWGAREFESIRRGEIVQLLDQVEDENGARTADLVLSIISGLVTHYAQRHEDYSTPLVKGMRRYDKAGNTRSRILSDDEIRQLFAADADIAKLALLTGQRIGKVIGMRWSDIAIDGTWTIPAEAREKVNAGELVLPCMALDIIKRQQRQASNPYVFAGRGYGEPRSYTGVDAGIKQLGVDWTLHDLRRTAKSFMARAGVLPHISERVLGHTIQGVEGVYDRHSYRDEKAQALKVLAGLIENILRPEDLKVVNLRG